MAVAVFFFFFYQVPQNLIPVITPGHATLTAWQLHPDLMEFLAASV